MPSVNQILTSVSAVDAPAIVNTTVETSLLGPSGVCTFPAGSLGEGMTIGMRMFGKFSNKASSPGTLTLQAKLGGLVVWSSGALNIPATAHSDITFFLDLMLVVRPAGRILGAGKLEAALSSTTDFFLPSTSPADAALPDRSVDNDLDITAKFSLADVGNKIQLLGYQVLC